MCVCSTRINKKNKYFTIIVKINLEKSYIYIFVKEQIFGKDINVIFECYNDKYVKV